MASPEVGQRLGEARAWRNKKAAAISSPDDLAVLRHEPLYQAARNLTIFDRWEKIGQKLPEFSEETWERAGRVFSGINNGVKAALFVDIAQNTRPGMYMPIKDVVDHFKDLFDGTQLLEAFGDRNTQGQVIQYCQQSLCNVGLLTAEYNLGGKPIGFGVTEEGLESGLPHALRLLEWENAMKESAYPILGITASQGQTRAPFNSARILEYLFRHPYNVSDADLVDASGANSASIYDAIKRFHAFGLVDYKSVDYHTSKAPLEYAWDTNRDLLPAPYVTESHEVEDKVIRVIQQKGLANPTPKFSIRDIIQELPEEIRKKWKDRVLRTEISGILSGLASSEYRFLQRVNDFKSGEKLSDVALKQKGRSFFLRVILPTLLNSPAQPLRVNLSQLAQTSAELYYPYSQSSKTREHKKNVQRLIEIIGGSNNPKTARELATIVNLSMDSIRVIFSPHIKGSSEVVLEVDGQPVTIERRKEKGVWYYSLKSPTVSNP